MEGRVIKTMATANIFRDNGTLIIRENGKPCENHYRDVTIRKSHIGDLIEVTGYKVQMGYVRHDSVFRMDLNAYNEEDHKKVVPEALEEYTFKDLFYERTNLLHIFRKAQPGIKKRIKAGYVELNKKPIFKTFTTTKYTIEQ